MGVHKDIASLNRLRQKIAHAKDASMFEAKEAAFTAIDEAAGIMEKFDERLGRIEKLFPNVETIK